MKTNTSVRLTEEAQKALAFLKEQMGGFNFNKAFNQFIVQAAKTKGWLGLLVLFLTACGAGSPESPAVPTVINTPATITEPAPTPTIKQSGVITNEPTAKPITLAETGKEALYKLVHACVKANYVGPVNSTPPQIVLLAGVFTVGDRTDVRAATDLPNNTIYITNCPFPGKGPNYSYAHEFIHQLTGIGNEGHDTPLFQSCEDPE